MPFKPDQPRVQSTANVGGRTKQSFQFDADPNTLMRQFTKTGDVEILKRSTAVAMHGDFSAVPDFFTALLQVQQVQEDFAALPSGTRSHFDNDPSKLIDAYADPSRLDELAELGLVDPVDPISAPPPSVRPETTPVEPQPEELPEP